MELGYEDPVNPSFDATTQMYHDCLEECLRRIKFNKSFGDTQKVGFGKDEGCECGGFCVAGM